MYHGYSMAGHKSLAYNQYIYLDNDLGIVSRKLGQNQKYISTIYYPYPRKILSPPSPYLNIYKQFGTFFLSIFFFDEYSIIHAKLFLFSI